MTCFLAIRMGSESGPIFRQTRPMYYLTGDSGELEHMQRLVEHTGTLVNVHNHRRFPLTYKEVLEQSCQLAVSEWHYSWIISENFSSEGYLSLLMRKPTICINDV